MRRQIQLTAYLVQIPRWISSVIVSATIVFMIAFSHTSGAESPPMAGHGLQPLGRIIPRHAKEIAANQFAIGAETMDRDLIKFESWKEHLGSLGAKQLRLQAGWAKVERSQGIYDWVWLDEVIDHAIEEGVKPWLQTSYGNPIYQGGGGIHLSAGLPSSEVALAAWDRWITAMAERYRGKVRIWEIWNEVDLAGNNPPEDYAAFYIRTAENIRRVDPGAKLFALSLANVGLRGRQYATTFFDELQANGKLHLVDEVCVHGYTFNPSDSEDAIQEMSHLVAAYSKQIKVRQGEVGCPSEYQTIYALRCYDWSETSQSKWIARKLLSNLGRGIPTCYFQTIDVVYTHYLETELKTPKRNTKGLIQADLDRNFVLLKPSFRTFQTVTSIFDDKLRGIRSYPFTTNTERSVAVLAFLHDSTDHQLVATWFDDETPNDATVTTPVTLSFQAAHFEDPVVVDVRTGRVYKIPRDQWRVDNDTVHFDGIPLYDSPVLIAERCLLRLDSGDATE